MELGYFAMPLHPPGSDFAQTVEDDLEQIVTLDRLGYREAWIGEHFTSEWENIPAPDLFIANALARTEKIILGTGVSCMPNHNPFVLAHQIAQLDQMARGRFYWGIGAGGFPGDLDAFGYGEDRRDNRVMTRHAVEAVLELWDDPEPGPRKNEFWEYAVPEPNPKYGLRVHMKPFQKPHPPIGVAGVTPNSGTLALAGARGWIPMSINLVPTWVLKTHWQSVEAAALKADREPDRSQWRIAREVYVAETTEEARREAREGVLARDWDNYFHHILSRDEMIGITKVDPDMPDEEVTVDYLIDNVWVIGSPDEVAARLNQLYEDVGGFGVLLAMAHEWQPLEAWQRSMRLLKDEVLPQLPTST